MTTILPGTAELITFDGDELSVENLPVEGRVCALVKDGVRCFGLVRARPAESTDELVELRLLSGAVIRVPTDSEVLVDGPGPLRVRDIDGGPCENIQPAKEVRRRWHSEWQTIRVAGKNSPGAALLQSWTDGVVEVLREKVTVEMVVSAPLFEVSFDGEALAITAQNGAGEPADGVLVAGAAR